MVLSPTIRLLSLAVLAAAVLAPSAAASDPAAVRTITQGDLEGHIRFLASEELEGRGIGQPGGRVTQRYLASYYTRLGLRPAGEDGTFFQEFESRGRNGRNVLALRPGSDPKLRDEVVVVLGHADHLGRGRDGEGPVYNGADDNASGTAAILEIAEAFTAAPTRRTLLFFNTDGEESGLLGSRHWIENPTVPLDRIVAAVCMDMIGRSEDDYLFIAGTGTSPSFPELIEGLNERFEFALEIAEGGRVPTDSAAFYGADVSVLFFFTNLHDDYHRPTDDIEKLNFDAMTRITRMIFLATHAIADGPTPPAFTSADSMALPEDFGERMRSRMANLRANNPYLGVGPVPDDEGEGFLVGEVVEGAPASKAGIRAGDRILEIGGTPVEGLAGLRRALSSKKVGQTVDVKLVRNGEERVVPVLLGSMSR